MRLLPKDRRTRLTLAAALTVLVVAVAAAWVAWYRPWQAHYLGRPTSWWADRLAVLSFDLFGPRPPRTLPEEWLNRALSSLGVRVDESLSGREVAFGEPEAIPVLLELLRDPRPHVRRWAALSLEGMEPPPREAIPALLGAWQRYRDDYRGPRGVGFTSPRDAVREIRDALWRIDPDAAGRAGVPRGVFIDDVDDLDDQTDP
jgi:hypothetical protein